MTDSDRRPQHDASPEASSESRSGVRGTGVASLLEAALSRRDDVTSDVIDALIAAALVRAGLSSLPSDPTRVRAFLAGALAAEVDARFGADAVREVAAFAAPLSRALEARGEVGARAARARSIAARTDTTSSSEPPRSAEIPAVIYVLADRPAIAARVRMLLGTRAEVIRARSLEDVLRASVLRTGWRSAVLIDLRPGCVLEMPSAETLVRVLGRMPAIVWGDEATAEEVRWRTGGSERVTPCCPSSRPEDIALLLELQLTRT